MLYYCLTFTAQVVPADAKTNPNKVYFQGEFISKEDDQATKVIKVNLFPETDAQQALWQEMVDNSKVLKDAEYEPIHVELPPYHMYDQRKAGEFIKRKDGSTKVFTGMDVYMRILTDKLNGGFRVDGNPKAKAEQTVDRLGKWIGTGATHVETVINPTPAADAAHVAVPTFTTTAGN